MKKKFLSVLLAGAMLAGLAAGCAKAPADNPDPGNAGNEGGEPQKKYVLKFNHVLTDKDPYHQAYLDWAKAVEERTNGGLTIEVFHSAQLGVEEDIIEQIKAGANIGQNTDSARLGNYVPDIAVMNAPYFVDSIDEVKKLNELDTVQGWLDTLAKEHGIKVLSFEWVQGFRHMMTNKKITKPSDLNDQRIRTPGAPIWQESIRAVGATPIALPMSEMYSAIQNKTIEGVDNVYPNTYSTKLYEVLKYANETRHILLINFAVVSNEWFESLPKEYQDILVEECNKAGLAASEKIMGELTETAKKNLEAEGMIIVPESEIDMEAFKAAGEAAYEKLGLTEVRDQIYKELGKTK